jgi:hypothetical protein
MLMVPLPGLGVIIPALLRKRALEELGDFPPVQGWKRIGLWVCFLSTTPLIFSPLLASNHPAGNAVLPAGSPTLAALP